MQLEFNFVSIPFRADTGFEHNLFGKIQWRGMSFQSLSGLTLGLNLRFISRRHQGRVVSIPFRADTGFEPDYRLVEEVRALFQSLSGLTLGLNGRRPESRAGG